MLMLVLLILVNLNKVIVRETADCTNGNGIGAMDNRLSIVNYQLSIDLLRRVDL